MIIQTCNRCYKNLPLSSFSKRKDFIKTLNTYQIHYNKVCKSCISVIKKRWRDSHPGYFKAYQQGHESDPITKVCLNCGIEFITQNPLQKYCDPGCKKVTREAEFKEWRKHYPGVSKEVFRRMIFQKLKA